MGDTWVIDSGMYFDAAKKCQSLASDMSLALGPLQRALVHDCGGMAGDHEKSKDWTAAYDRNACDIVTLAATLCNALQRFGDVLAANGYNWWQSNRSTTSGTEPTRPTPSEPLYDSGMALPTTAKGANGAGIDTSITGLLEQVGKIPNGDVTKLGIAADAWKTFANNTNITTAADRIKGIDAKFTGSSDPNIRDIEEKLTTLQRAAELLSQAAIALAGPVKDHHDALDTMRNDVQSAVASAAKELAGAVVITVAIVGILAVVSAGTAAAPAAAGGVAVTAEIVTTTAGIIRNTVSISRILIIFGAVVVAGTATGVFTAIPDLTQNGINAALASIAAMTVKIIGDESSGTGGDGATSTANARNTPGTPEYAARVEELAKDPAHGGKITDKSRREAEVALGMEHDGQLNGPVTRAPMENGKDTGDFVDGDGQHWDMKQPTDTFPPTAGPMAGQPMPPTMRGAYNAEEFEKMVGEELGTGENVMIDRQNLSEAGLQSVQEVVGKHPEWAGKVVIYGK
ncbi:hypothetical protein [Nocardia sp. NPDC052112]|uniref:hypothetical protein n=1 Tax=Nocardia sp. NPDC052112 TaxID=3155646 RepID=UPI003420219B